MSKIDFKYNSIHCIISMMSRYNKLFDHGHGYHKNKNEAVLFDPNLDADYKKISYHYIYKKPSFKPDSMYKLTQIVSHIGSEVMSLKGKRWREIRESRNKWDRQISVKNHCDINNVLDLIKIWEETCGTKYGFHLRSGKDKNFFKTWYSLEKDKLVSNFFYRHNYLIGYSILSWNGKNWDYLLRKYANVGRNICLYIDYKTFERIYETFGEGYVNWGGNGKKLLRYKKKFGVFEERDVFMYKVVK